MINYRIYCDHHLIYSSPNQSLATKKILTLTQKNPNKDYSLTEELVLLTPEKVREINQGSSVEEALSQGLLPFISTYALDPKILSVLKSLQKATLKGDVKKINNLFKNYKGAKTNLKSIKNPKLVSPLIKKSLKIAQLNILDNYEDLDLMVFYFNDVISFLRIAQALSKGEDQKAYSLMDKLDSEAQENLPKVVWRG